MSAFILPLLTFGAGVLLAIILLLLWAPWERNLRTETNGSTVPNRKPLPPQVGYKKAWLRHDKKERRTMFQGVSQGSHGYQLDSEAATNAPGFHAYYDLSSAVGHDQKGNVYLEVLGSGKVEEHESGFTASHQRVLQIIIGECSQKNCSRQAEYWTKDSLCDGPLCRRCRIRFLDFPISKLEKQLAKRWGADIPVVVLQSTERNNSFIPTIQNSDSTMAPQ